MSKALVSDELWTVIAPLLSAEPPMGKGGRPHAPDRAALSGIIFALKSGIGWEHVAPRDGLWQRDEMWAAPAGLAKSEAQERLHQTLLQRLADADKLDWTRVAGLSECSGQKKGEATGPNATDRSKPDTKRHLMVDADGIYLAVMLSAANVHESHLVEAILGAFPSPQEVAC